GVDRGADRLGRRDRPADLALDLLRSRTLHALGFWMTGRREAAAAASLRRVFGVARRAASPGRAAQRPRRPAPSAFPRASAETPCPARSGGTGRGAARWRGR